MTSRTTQIGAHISTAGGVDKSIGRATNLGCDCLQIFVKNNSRWVGTPLTEDVVQRFKRSRAASQVGPIVAHASYLINLAALDPRTLERSRDALADELERCERLELDGLVLHPGAHLGAGEAEGLDLAARSLDLVLANKPGTTPILLENTAGQGTTLGSTLAQLESLIARCDGADRLGVCIDTCHAFAAGYPIHRAAGYSDFWAEVDAVLGLERVRCLHINDSAKPFDSRRDRHANLGHGEIGIECFEQLVADPALIAVPMILETPRGADGAGHRRDLELLRSAEGAERA